MILGRRERAFVLASLFHRHLDLESLRQAAEGAFDWPRVAARATRIGTAAFLWNAAQESGVAGRIPQATRDALESEYQRNTAANSGTLALLARVQRALAHGGIESLPLKGAALLLHEPRLIPLRHVDDLDLLVRPADAARAAEMLKASGWGVLEEGRDFRGVPLAQSDAGRMHHGVTLVGPTGLALELHHALPAAPGAPRRADDGLFARAVSRPFAGHDVRCPALEDLFSMICEHTLIHHHGELVSLPRLVADLQVMLDLGVDPSRAGGTWDAGTAEAVRRGLRLLEETRAAARQPDPLGRGLVEKVYSPLWYWLNEARLTLGAWLAAPRIFAGAVRRNGWRAVVPSRSYMAARYGISPGSPMMPVLYLWRPVRGAFRLIFRR